jgi:hypothetical protein
LLKNLIIWKKETVAGDEILVFWLDLRDRMTNSKIYIHLIMSV